MKNTYNVTYDAGDGSLLEELVVADTTMAGAQNGVLVLFNYEQNASPELPAEPRMVRMFAAGCWKMVENQGPHIQPVEESRG